MEFKYKGYFVNGKKHGLGLIKTIEGKKYFGEWVEDSKNGKGR